MKTIPSRMLPLFTAVLVLAACGCTTPYSRLGEAGDSRSHRLALAQRFIDVSDAEVLTHDLRRHRLFLEGLPKTSGKELDAALAPMNAVLRRRAAEALAAEFTAEELAHLAEVYTDPVIQRYWNTFFLYEHKVQQWRMEFLDAHPDLRQKYYEWLEPSYRVPAGEVK